MIEKFELTNIDADDDLGIVEMKTEFIPTDKECGTLNFAEGCLVHIDEIHLVYILATGETDFFAYDNSHESALYFGCDVAVIDWELSPAEKKILEKEIHKCLI